MSSLPAVSTLYFPLESQSEKILSAFLNEKHNEMPITKQPVFLMRSQIVTLKRGLLGEQLEHEDIFTK